MKYERNWNLLCRRSAIGTIHWTDNPFKPLQGNRAQQMHKSQKGLDKCLQVQIRWKTCSVKNSRHVPVGPLVVRRSSSLITTHSSPACCYYPATHVHSQFSNNTIDHRSGGRRQRRRYRTKMQWKLQNHSRGARVPSVDWLMMCCRWVCLKERMKVQ